jgi:hypothetical protein
VTDWETAFNGRESTLETDPYTLIECEFGLQYLLDGFVTGEGIERKWKLRDQRKQLTLPLTTVASTSSSYKV